MKGKRWGEALIFFLVMGLSFYAVFHGQDLAAVGAQLRRLSPVCLVLALAAAVFFVCAEGFMIWYLLCAFDGRSSLARCMSYSFIGFFYSGITPSATGGQPMQLYYMKKDGNRLSDSSVILMVVALVYKFVLVVCGALLLIFWYRPLRLFLGGYFGLYLTGLSLNVILVAVLLAVMLCPNGIRAFLFRVERLLVKIRILRASEERKHKIGEFVGGYQNAVSFLLGHRRKVLVVVAVTFLQRCSVFLLTGIIYHGFHLQGTAMATILFLQASVYIAVDMLPVPGAQGITELMYRSVFSTVFTGGMLMPSLYVTRGINFYFLLIVSALFTAGNWFFRRANKSGDE